MFFRERTGRPHRAERDLFSGTPHFQGIAWLSARLFLRLRTRKAARYVARPDP